MNPLLVLCIGLVANVVAVAITHVLAPDWQVGAASVSAFLAGVLYWRAVMLQRVVRFMAETGTR